MVVEALERFWILRQDTLHYLRQKVEVVEEYDEHRAMLLRLHQGQLRLRPECERPLRAADKLREIERVCFCIADPPERVAGRVLRHLRSVLLDERGILGDESVHRAIYLTFERLELLLLFQFRRRERPERRLRAVREDDIDRLDIFLCLAVLEGAFAAGIVRHDAAECGYLAARGIGGEEQPLFLECRLLEIPIKDARLGDGVAVADLKHLVHMLHKVHDDAGGQGAAGHVGPRGASCERDFSTSTSLGTYDANDFGNIVRVFGVHDQLRHPLEEGRVARRFASRALLVRHLPPHHARKRTLQFIRIHMGQYILGKRARIPDVQQIK